MKNLLVGGGTKTVTTALKSRRVDEVYLDIEPWFLGEGLSLFTKLPFDFKLKLLGVRRIGKNGVQLRYKIKK